MIPDPRQLLYAYSQGIFPMAGENGDILWYDPDPRAIMPLEQFHIPRRLARTVRQEPYEIRVDTAFADVINLCAAPTPDRKQTWISPTLIELYIELHRLGFAHSVETWQDGQLVGGLYGVALNSLFAGESMFSRERDASKVALVYLIRRLRQREFLLLDIQFLTDHLAQFGAIEIPRAEYKARLQQAILKPNQFATS